LFFSSHYWITDSCRRQPLPPLDLDDSLRSDDQFLPEAQVDARLALLQVGQVADINLEF
jgi:hypothetical protein